MSRYTLLAVALGAFLLSGCAVTPTASEESELVARIRAELDTDPMLVDAQVSVTERDGTIVIGGFADSLDEIEAVRDAAERVDGTADIENDVVIRVDG